MAEVRHNTASEQFEITLEGSKAILQYGIGDGTMTMYHTEVPPVFRGRGYGELLARAALDYARSQALKVRALCPFVRGFIERHPEYR